MDVKKADKLSSLPDVLIHKILSFIDIKDTVRTSVLSSRWRFIWTSMPYLNISTKKHAKLGGYGPDGFGRKFHKFANNFLSRRNNQIDASSLEFHFSDRHCTPDYFKTIMDHACLHNVQQMTITQMNVAYCSDHNFPICFFSSQSLKHLTLIKFAIDHYKSQLTWDLPALTKLHLYKATLSRCDSVLVMFPNLKNLTINKCIVHDHESNGFSIINSRLLNLTLKDVKWKVGFILIDTPQLKNLVIVDTEYNGSISDLSGELTISAPDLVHLLVKGSYCPNLSLDGFNSLEKADIHISSPLKTDVPRIYDLLQHLQCVKFLALSLEIVELLSSSAEVISPQLSPFASLTCLKIYPAQVNEREELKKVNVSTEVKSYLLDGSPRADFTLLTPEDVIANRITKAAKDLIFKLQVHLEQVKADIKDNTNIAPIEQGNTPMESQNAMVDEEQNAKVENQLQIERNMAHIDNCWGGLSNQIIQGTKKIDDIVFELHGIKNLLVKLPASYRAETQQCFSSLCAEADIVMLKITDCMKTQLDKNKKLSDFMNL